MRGRGSMSGCRKGLRNYPNIWKMRTLAFILLLIPLASPAQEEEAWDVYLAQYDKGPGSTLLNMNLKQVAPVKTHPYLLKTGVRFKNCNGDGLPEQGEFAWLNLISEAAALVVKRFSESVLAGTFTYQCERNDYYYVSDTAGIRDALMRMYSSRFAKYTPLVSITKDEKWETYLTFLYPNEETQEYMSNSKVVMELEKAGDKLEKERQVDHWIYFPTERDRKCFISYCTAQKFKIEAQETSKESKLPFKLQISRIDKADLSSISVLTLELRRQAAKCKGDYDGWETFVIKD